MWRRFLGLGAALTGLLGPAQAQTGAPVTANSAPAAWMQYAKLVEQKFEDRLGGDSTAAQRLRTYLSASPQPQAAVVPVSVWVDRQGKVTRVAFAPFLDSQANTDLSGLLQGMRLTQTPPSDMLLPIHLKLQIAASPAAQAASPPVSPAAPRQH